MPTNVTDELTGGQLVVECLKRLGVRFVFGVPGGQTLAITDAILDDPDIEFVTVRHEGSAAVMADAIGRLTGSPGVCLATTGPGATNLLTGVGGAMRDSSPVIVMTCNNRLPDVERDDAQNADHVSIFRSLTKWTHFVAETATIPRVVAEAGNRAVAGNPGPVLLDFARSALEGLAPASCLESAPARPSVIGLQRLRADEERLDEAVACIRDAKRPLLWVGNGTQLSGAEQAVLEFAERIEAPVITTFNAVGSVPSDHGHAFGVLTRMGTRLAAQVLADSDALIALGNSLNAVSTGRWSLPLPGTIVQVDIDPDLIGRNYPGKTVPVVGDVGKVILDLTARLGEDLGDLEARRERLDRLREHKAAWWQQAADAIDLDRSPMSPADLVQCAREGAPSDTVLVVDAGNPGVWSYLWRVSQAGGYLKPVGFGNMGFGLPAMVSTALARPEQPVVGLIGDGSLGMNLGELDTVAQRGGRACVVVMNDCAYGNIKQEQAHHLGEGRYIGVDLPDVDFVSIARAFGMEAYRLDEARDLAATVEKVLDSGRPGLIDARIDGDVSAWTYELFDTNV